MELLEKDIIEQYGGMVHGFVCRIITNPEDAEEISEDVFIRAFRSWDKYDKQKANLSTWLLRIAWNEVFRYLKRQQRCPTMVEIDEQMKIVAEDAEDERLLLLERAILQLKDKERMLLEMRYKDGMSFKEISYIMNARAGTLSVRLQRIRTRLKDIINRMMEK